MFFLVKYTDESALGISLGANMTFYFQNHGNWKKKRSSKSEPRGRNMKTDTWHHLSLWEESGFRVPPITTTCLNHH